MFAVYFFMTGEYQFYAVQAYSGTDGSVQSCLAASNAGGRAYGPRQMMRWMWRNVRCPSCVGVHVVTPSPGVYPECCAQCMRPC